VEIKLTKPVTIDGNVVSKLVLDLDNIKGSDIIAVEREVRAQGDLSPNPLFTSFGLATVAAKASGINVDDIQNLHAPDFVQVTNTVSNFLYGWVLPNQDLS